VLPPPATGTPEHPIYYPPVVWPDPPESYPSIDPDQLPGHPELPDLNRGVWTWLQQGDAVVRAFAVPTFYAGHDLPSYEPKEPPQSQQPGDWVIGMFQGGPAWCWLPSSTSGGDEPVVTPHQS
jgi:hypothetical protein